MSRTITIRFKNGVPVSNARDPQTRREAEAFGAAFLKAAKEGRPTLDLSRVRVTDESASMAVRVLEEASVRAVLGAKDGESTLQAASREMMAQTDLLRERASVKTILGAKNGETTLRAAERVRADRDRLRDEVEEMRSRGRR